MEFTKHFYQSSEIYKVPKDLVFYDVKEHESIAVHGIFDDKVQAGFERMPQSAAEAVNARVACLYSNPSGGRVRFRTNSTRLAARAAYPNLTPRSILTSQTSMGFDIYVRKTASPPFTLHCIRPSI